jgi:hypothetical protein
MRSSAASMQPFLKIGRLNQAYLSDHPIFSVFQQKVEEFGTKNKIYFLNLLPWRTYYTVH